MDHDFGFCIDAAKSINVMKTLLSKLKKDDQVMINENMKINDHHDSSYMDKYEIIDHKHKLSIIEISLDDCDGNDDVRNFYEQIHEAYMNNDYNISHNIEIYHGSKIAPVDHQIDILNECPSEYMIHLKAYLHNTTSECDISYPLFKYDSQLKCWIVKDGFWGTKKGIDCNGIVTILNLSEYD